MKRFIPAFVLLMIFSVPAFAVSSDNLCAIYERRDSDFIEIFCKGNELTVRFHADGSKNTANGVIRGNKAVVTFEGEDGDGAELIFGELQNGLVESIEVECDYASLNGTYRAYHGHM